MSTGTSMEQDPEPDPKTHEADPTGGHEEEAVVVAQKGADGKTDVVPLAAHLEQRGKAEKRGEAKARLEMQKEIDEAKAIKQSLEQYGPILQRIQQDPSILERARQPQKTERDVEAEEVAEDLGLIAADGSLDVNRARRYLDRQDQRNGKLVDQRVAPVANATASQIANGHRLALKSRRHEDGRPVASAESIDAVANVLPPELVANPNVAQIMELIAIGLDQKTGRTPKAPVARMYDEPWLSEGAGRGPGSRSVLTDEDKRFAKNLGLDEKTYAKQVEDLHNNGRRGVALE